MGIDSNGDWFDGDLAQFQAVCPHCSASFTLDEEVICKGFDDERAEEYLKIMCPVCGGTKLIDVI